MIRAGTRKWWALGALTLSVLAVGLDGTILSVALPTLAGSLHATESDLQWFSSGYLLVLAAGMLPAGLLGDRYGRKKVLLAALVLFAAGSAACAYAPSTGAFIAARAALGLAGAGIVVMALSALTVLFREEERPRAVSVWAAANFLALPIGPILGGWLLTHYWWGWVFLINVPVSLVGVVAALALVPESRAAERPGLDPVGMLASVAGLTTVTYGLIQAGQQGWTDPAALGPIGAGLAVLVGFFYWERWLGRRPHGQPLVDLTLFRSASFTWGLVLTATAGLAMIGVIFTLPQYFQAVLGTDALGSGVRVLPLIGGMVVGVLPAARLARLAGAKATVAFGFAVMAGGALLGATTGIGSGIGLLIAWTAVLGAGLGIAFATAASAAISELPAERSGVGAAVFQALQKVGAPFGAAVLGSVLSAAYQADLHLAGLPPSAASAVREGVFGGLAVARALRSQALLDSVRAAFVHGMDTALLVSAGVAVAGILLALAFLPNRAAAGAAAGGRADNEGTGAIAG
jgi:DHA2 family multidrug resistance protein-like MFS transporter